MEKMRELGKKAVIKIRSYRGRERERDKREKIK